MQLESTRIFVKVVQLGSFSKAADWLKLPKSSVSRSVSGLEKETGTRLLLRTTRSLTLTAAGRAFYDSCLAPVQALEDAQKSLFGQDSMLTGTLRITAPEDLGTQVIAPAIAKLAMENSGLRFELIYTDEVLDLIKDGFDMAVRIGPLQPSSYRAKKLGEVILGAVASPEYLKKAPKILTPSDLTLHDCLSYLPGSNRPRWALKRKQETKHIPISPRLVSNQMTSLVRMATAGAGIALVPLHLSADAVASGRLQRVLPEWSSPGFQVSLLTPLASTSSARLRISAEYVGNEVARALKSYPGDEPKRGK